MLTLVLQHEMCLRAHCVCLEWQLSGYGHICSLLELNLKSFLLIPINNTYTYIINLMLYYQLPRFIIAYSNKESFKFYSNNDNRLLDQPFKAEARLNVI
jgi:hypothetical protein